MIRIVRPDGSRRSIRAGACVRDLLDAIDPRLAATLPCVAVDGELHDLRARLTSDCEMAFHTADTPEGRTVLCHTAAHVAAQAIKRLFPNVVLGADPASDGGFRLGFHVDRQLTDSEVAKIEAEMVRIIEEDLPIERQEVSKGDARSLLIRHGEVLKLELLEEIDRPMVTLYRQGDHVDLCSGPHALSTGFAPRVRLIDLGLATWRNDPHAEPIARIGGTVVRSV